MNHSRQSYTLPIDTKYGYTSDVILNKCEFCNRTFIPDSLVKHRKVCYRDYLKKRSKISNLKSSNMVRSKSSLSSYRIPQGINLTALMISRQTRRMNWRSRHEEFIQTIRLARDYSIAVSNGISSQPPISSMDNKENMKQCKYCLRKFHKDSIIKHLSMCKEHSIQSSRSRPNEAHIQAKRRLSLRLYYKPRSFRGDSPDDQTTSISSRDLDCLSAATFTSQNINTNVSQSSVVSTKSSVNQHNRTNSDATISISNVRSVPKKDVTAVSGRPKRCSSRDHRDNSQNRKSLWDNVEKHKLQAHRKEKVSRKSSKSRSKSIINIKVSEKSNPGKISEVSDNKASRKQNIAQKLKVISSILDRNKRNENVASDSCDIDNKFAGPDPSESFHKAKEILQYLDIRVKEKELVKEKDIYEESKCVKEFEVDDRSLPSVAQMRDAEIEGFTNVNNAGGTKDYANAFSSQDDRFKGDDENNKDLNLSEFLSGIIDMNENDIDSKPTLDEVTSNIKDKSYNCSNDWKDHRRVQPVTMNQNSLSGHRDSEYLRMWQR